MWNTRSCICDWFIRSLFSDHPHYLSCILLLEHRYGWTHIYYFFFFLFFLYSTFYLFFFLPKVALCCCCCCQLCNSLFTGCQQAEVHSHFLQISVLPAEINSDIPPQKKYSKINCHDEPCLKQNKISW